MELGVAAARLREAEKTAREVLNNGCSADLESIECFLDRPLSQAKAEFEAHIFGLGPVDVTLHRNILIQEVQEVAWRCARNVFANADVRFRARFRIYADVLAEAEQRFLDAARAAEKSLRIRDRRRITVPHLEPDDESFIILQRDVFQSTLDSWIAELEKSLRIALVREVTCARHVVLKRGSASLARTRVALRLASRGPLSL